MAKSKFKVGDNVKILSNDLQPGVTGKVGKVKKVYSSFTDDGVDGHHSFYRIELNGEALRGIAIDSDLEKA